MKRRSLPEKTKALFRKYYRDAKIPKMHDLEPLFIELINMFPSKVVIVIDALDECKNNLRAEVLEFIFRLTSEESTAVKTFVTCRREKDIKEAFDRCPKIEIDADSVNEDIKTFLRDEIDLRVLKKRLRLRDQQLKVVILDKLTSEAEGM